MCVCRRSRATLYSQSTRCSYTRTFLQHSANRSAGGISSRTDSVAYQSLVGTPWWSLHPSRPYSTAAPQPNRLHYPGQWNGQSETPEKQRRHPVRPSHRCPNGWATATFLPRQPVLDVTVLQRALMISAVRSLYEDRLKPTFVELRRRLQECRASPSMVRNLQSICAALSDSLIMEEKGVRLIHEPRERLDLVNRVSVLPFCCFSLFYLLLVTTPSTLCS